MSVTAISPIAAQRASPWSEFTHRLAATLSGASGPSASELLAEETPTTLTVSRLQATLISLGFAPDAVNQSLANDFARLGLALTRETLTEAHLALALAPNASPRAFALAKQWRLAATPAILNALTAATLDDSSPPQHTLPRELLAWLGFAAELQTDPEELAGHLFLLTQGIGRSTENRIAAASEQNPLGGTQDARSTLLRLALGSTDSTIQKGANALATHIEGQQLINQAMRHSGNGENFYLAIPVLWGLETGVAEMRLGLWDDEQDCKALSTDTAWLQATVRVATKRLGRIEIRLIGALEGKLVCSLRAERTATVRLLQRHAETLRAMLAKSGDWQVAEIQCAASADWPPLWHNGEAFTAPRACVDWRA